MQPRAAHSSHLLRPPALAPYKDAQKDEQDERKGNGGAVRRCSRQQLQTLRPEFNPQDSEKWKETILQSCPELHMCAVTCTHIPAIAVCKESMVSQELKRGRKQELEKSRDSRGGMFGLEWLSDEVGRASDKQIDTGGLMR